MKKLILALLLCAAIGTVNTTQAQVSVGLSINIAPPVLPVYTQPPCPYDGYIWTPGYWAYGPDGYYWVPGAWVMPPRIGFLWTPGYWGFVGGIYSWHAGYWGPHVGFYGGINYGFGYGGVGFCGGGWSGNVYRYNTAVTNVNTTIVHNTYVNNTVINNNTVVNNSRTSFNGAGGITSRPTRVEMAAARDQHMNATNVQMANQQTARTDRRQLASVNNGRPASMAIRDHGDHAPQPNSAMAPRNSNNNINNPGVRQGFTNNQSNRVAPNANNNINNNLAQHNNPNINNGGQQRVRQGFTNNPGNRTPAGFNNNNAGNFNQPRVRQGFSGNPGNHGPAGFNNNQPPRMHQGFAGNYSRPSFNGNPRPAGNFGGPRGGGGGGDHRVRRN